MQTFIFSDGAIKPTELKLINNNNRRERPIMDYFKEYFGKHRDAIFTLGIIILIDHFVFNGAFRDKIKKTVDDLLNKTQRNLAGNEV